MTYPSLSRGKKCLMNFYWSMGFPHSSVGKESACNAGDPSLIPGLGSSPGGGVATHSSILAWRIPWTVQSGRLPFMGLQQTRLRD